MIFNSKFLDQIIFYSFRLLNDTGLCGALRAMRILALEFLSATKKGSKRREAKCSRRDTQSCGELFFSPVSVKIYFVFFNLPTFVRNFTEEKF